jgi:casein kinase I family protein HRR25
VAIERPRLEYEASVYGRLAGCVGIPSVHYFGVDHGCRIMVLDLLGPNLEELFEYCHRKFSLKTVLFLADQILDRLEFIHAKSFILGDVRPENFCMGVGILEAQFKVASLGCARYQDFKGHHLPHPANLPFVAMSRYASVSTHRLIQQSRRDDLESLCYMLIYFCLGELPWQGLPVPNEVCDRILQAKTTISTEILCRGLPSEFRVSLDYVRSLQFAQEPDYHFLGRMFRDLYRRESFPLDNNFDWVVYRRFGTGRNKGPSQKESVGSPRHSFGLPRFALYGNFGALAQPELTTPTREEFVCSIRRQ